MLFRNSMHIAYQLPIYNTTVHKNRITFVPKCGDTYCYETPENMPQGQDFNMDHKVKIWSIIIIDMKPAGVPDMSAKINLNERVKEMFTPWTLLFKKLSAVKVKIWSIIIEIQTARVPDLSAKRDLNERVMVMFPPWTLSFKKLSAAFHFSI